MKTDAASLVAPGSGTSLHRQLFVVLRDGIVRGEHAAGAALPTEEALGAAFGVSRITVRRALGDLEAAGFVQRRHGKGTFVLPGGMSLQPAPTLGLVDALRRTATDTDVRVLDVRREVPPAFIGALLQLETGDTAVHALRLRSSGATPLLLTDAWVPERLGQGVTREALEKHALYEILLDQGVRFGRVVQEISAEAAVPARAALLQTETGAPLIRLTRLLHDDASRPVQHLTAWMSPERSRILMDIAGDDINTFGGGHIVHAPRYARGAGGSG